MRRVLLIPALAVALTSQCLPLPVELAQALEVQARTKGMGLDADGYTLSIDGSEPLPVEVVGMARFDGLNPGEHDLFLGDVAANCEVVGPNPKRVMIGENVISRAAFEVNCIGATVVVNVSTTGEDIDPDGFVVTLDGAPVGRVAASGTLTIPGLEGGTFVIGLDDVAPNCEVAGAPSVSAEAYLGGTVDVGFVVDCAGPDPGSIEVIATTAGTDPDDSYTVLLDGSQVSTVDANGSVTLTDIAGGTYEVTLGDVAGNCSVGNPAAVTVTVESNQTATATFGVDCTAIPPGSIAVAATTTGTDLDPDGYTVLLDGSQLGTVDANGTVTLTDIAVGAYEITLGDIAANCAVTLPAAATVTVDSNQTATATFGVDCTAIPPGSIAVAATTTGTDLDPDGYTVLLDGSQLGTVDANGTVTLTDIAVGTYEITLGDVAANCAVTSPTAVTVTVESNQTATATFTVDCTAIPPGSIAVTATTTGTAVDPDGYTVLLDGAPVGTVDANGTVTLTDIAVGTYEITLGDVAANCAVTSPTAVTVTVESNQTATATFTVDCTAIPPGSIAVTATTTGTAVDPDGYTVLLDGAPVGTVDANGTVTLTDIAVGTYEITLADIAANCAVTSPPAVTVTVESNQTATAPFSVDCARIATGSIELTVFTTGVDFDDEYTVLLDGAVAGVISGYGVLRLDDVPVGVRTLAFVDVAANCTVTSPSPANVTVTENNTSTILFTVECSPIDAPELAFSMLRAPEGTPWNAREPVVATPHLPRIGVLP